ncbi:MAG: Hg(II)-responsive transcriptional regulator [Gammaproteobacteria bacterium]|nr:Hg(II)-responsive transcriptional regulator [Gammaproteobacteria bacterium]MDH3857047.1 Hg(II)-responsive transcriptional regulator [Gammaproteobacteria bacterium]
MGLTIGRLASKAEINVETIRYYERRGLIKQPTKPKVGYRQYDSEILQRLLFIKRAKSLGFSLDEIESLLTLSEGRCADVQSLAEQKLNRVKAKVQDLKRLENVLQDLIRQCNSNVDQAHCPIIETLLNEE